MDVVAIWWTVKDVRVQRYSTQASGTPHIGACYDSNISNISAQCIWALEFAGSLQLSFLFSLTSLGQFERNKSECLEDFLTTTATTFHAAELNGNWNSAQNKHHSAIYLEWFLPLKSKGIINIWMISNYHIRITFSMCLHHGTPRSVCGQRARSHAGVKTRALFFLSFFSMCSSWSLAISGEEVAG
jgi:hypothetical protein